MSIATTPAQRAVVELKVVASTAAAGIAGVGVTVLNEALGDNALLGALPPWSQTLITLFVPPLATFLAGWKARHTPRPDLAAPAAAPPVVPPTA